jgi:hypothetical protein
MSAELENLAAEIDSLAEQVTDAIFIAVRTQMRNEEVENAKALEKRLAKVRRHLSKASALLRSSEVDED